MSVKLNSQKKGDDPIKSILNELNEIACFSYFEYVAYEGRTLSIYSSNDAVVTQMLKDGQSHFPLYDKQQRQYLRWGDYLSHDHLELLQSQWGLSRNGFTLVLNHQNMSEHFSLATNDVNFDVFEYLSSHPQILNTIVDKIRCYVYSQKLTPGITIDLSFPVPCFFNDGLPEDLLTQLTDSAKHYVVVGPNGQFTNITAKEKYCLVSMVQLKTLQDIAHDLKVSLKAVDSSLSRIKQKLGVTNRTQLYDIAKNNQLL